jgi:hypothetical protein
VRFDQSAIRLAMELSNSGCEWYALRVVCTMHLILHTASGVHYVPVLPGAVGTVPPAIPSTSAMCQSLECAPCRCTYCPCGRRRGVTCTLDHCDQTHHARASLPAQQAPEKGNTREHVLLCREHVLLCREHVQWCTRDWMGPPAPPSEALFLTYSR